MYYLQISVKEYLLDIASYTHIFKLFTKILPLLTNSYYVIAFLHQLRIKQMIFIIIKIQRVISEFTKGIQNLFIFPVVMLNHNEKNQCN